jgi:ATP-dependent DNA helicase RecQ
MRLVVDSTRSVAGSTLSLRVSGFDIELSDISGGEKLVISEYSGRVSVEFVAFERIAESAAAEAVSAAIVADGIAGQPVLVSAVTEVIPATVLPSAVAEALVEPVSVATITEVTAEPVSVAAITEVAAAEPVSGSIITEATPAAALVLAKPKKGVSVEPSQEDSVVKQSSSSEALFQRLSVLRKKVASEQKLPPYIIFHDSTLREMIAHMPTDLVALIGISGVGQSKMDKYGSRFVEVIKEYLAEVA